MDAIAERLSDVSLRDILDSEVSSLSTAHSIALTKRN